MDWQRFLSRKFLMAVAALVIDIAVGLGYNLDPLLVAAIAGAIATIYMAIEGILDGLDIRNNGE